MIPKITVLMPVYNGEKYLREAVDSILDQTFKNFEFLIINDGSTDNTVKIIESYQDRRIRLVHNEKNIGLAETCNRGIELAQGEYIARMDSDDISLPNRLEKQVMFMDANQDIGISGTWAKIIGENSGYVLKKPISPKETLTELFFNTCFVHPTVIIRRDMVNNSKIKYRKEFEPGDDYVFWTEISKFTKFANIAKSLLLYRMHPTNISKVKNQNQIKGASQARLNLILKLNITPTDEDLKIHSTLLANEVDIMTFLNQTESWLNKLLNANCQGIFDIAVFNKTIARRWLVVCDANAMGGWIIWKKFWKSNLSRFIKLKYEWISLGKFFIKCLIKKNKLTIPIYK